MDPTELDNLNAFHRQLVALDAAGVPLGLSERGGDAAEVLDRFHERLKVRVELGQSINDAIASEQELPTRYRCAALTLLASGSRAQALEAITRGAGGGRGFRRSLFGAMVTPTIIAGLVYAGLISLCLYTAPRFEALFDQVQQTLPLSLVVLRWLREWLPVWAPLAPVLFLIGAFAARHADWRRLLGRAPAMRRFNSDANRAVLADQLTRLSEHRLPLSAAIEPAHAGQAPAADLIDDADLPPLLRWSLAEQESPERLTDNLRVASATYRQAARRRARYWHAAGPLFASALIGGGVLLAYGCALFAPFATLMERVAQPTTYTEIQAPPAFTTEGSER